MSLVETDRKMEAFEQDVLASAAKDLGSRAEGAYEQEFGGVAKDTLQFKALKLVAEEQEAYTAYAYQGDWHNVQRMTPETQKLLDNLETIRWQIWQERSSDPVFEEVYVDVEQRSWDLLHNTLTPLLPESEERQKFADENHAKNLRRVVRKISNSPSKPSEASQSQKPENVLTKGILTSVRRSVQAALHGAQHIVGKGN